MAFPCVVFIKYVKESSSKAGNEHIAFYTQIQRSKHVKAERRE